jgi:ABC-type uncharacterized transport system substrate-binding protein
MMKVSPWTLPSSRRPNRLAVPLAGEGQESGKVWRIGFLGLPSASSSAARVEAFRRGLQELGYAEGRNLAIQFRWANGDVDRLPTLAAELARLKVDVIVTQGGEATDAARRATTTIPIVFAVVSNPVGIGRVHSLARPGGNVTGLSDIAEEVARKRVELLREALPGASRIAVFWNPKGASSSGQIKDMEEAGRRFGLAVGATPVRDTKQLDDAFAMAIRDHAGAVVVLPDAVFLGLRGQLAQLAVKNRLPAIAWTQEFPESGCTHELRPQRGGDA